MVTFIVTAVASDGMVQLPLVPVICTVCTPVGPIGVERGPMVSGAGRVSVTRHGVIGTNTDVTPDDAAALTTAPMASAAIRTPTVNVERDLRTSAVPTVSRPRRLRHDGDLDRVVRVIRVGDGREAGCTDRDRGAASDVAGGVEHGSGRCSDAGRRRAHREPEVISGQAPRADHRIASTPIAIELNTPTLSTESTVVIVGEAVHVGLPQAATFNAPFV
jgi:hypothetical protein